MGKEGEIRQKILGMDLLEAVIGLGPNLFYGTGLAACILVFRQRKKRRTARTRCSSSMPRRSSRPAAPRTNCSPSTSSASIGWYRDYKDVEGIARVVTLEEIAANDHNLNIPRYVEPKVEQEVLTVERR